MSLRKDNVIEDVMELLIAYGPEKFKESMELIYNHAMQIERSQVLQAAPYERTDDRQGYANGFKPKKFNTNIGTLDLQIPQVRGDIDFYPSSLERGTRSEKALKLALAEMYIQGVSTRKVTAITEKLCGLNISSTQVSRLSKELDEHLQAFRERPLIDPYEYVYLDATYEKVRYSSSVISMAVLVAIGVNQKTGCREILGISAELSEAEIHWRHFMENLHKRGLHGVKLFISDDHSGLKAARKHQYATVPWQRCQFHFQQNALNYVPKRAMREEVSRDIKYIFNAKDGNTAGIMAAEIVKKYEKSAPDFSRWLDENIEEALTVFNFPEKHRRLIRTVNGVERLNEEIKRRTRVARIFPNPQSCLRLITAVLIEKNDVWMTGRKYMSFETEFEILNLSPFYRKNVA